MAGEWEDAPAAAGGWEDAPAAPAGGAMNTLTSIPGNIAGEFQAGTQEVNEAFAEKQAMLDARQRPWIVDPRGLPSTLKMAGGALRQAFSPFTGAAKSLVGDPIRGLPEFPGQEPLAVTGEILGGGFGAPYVAKGASEMMRGIGRAITPKSTGKIAEQSAESLRARAVGETSDIIGEQEAAMSPFQRKIAAVEKAQAELATGADVAAARARAKALRPEEVAAEKQRVLDDLRDRARAAEAEYRSAGATADEARMAVAQNEARVMEAETAVTGLEQKLLSTPGMTADQFGAELRKSTQDLHDKYVKIRKDQSGFGAALDSAGDSLRIETKTISDSIDAQLKGIRNPALEGVLKEVKSLLQSDGKDALTIRSADSLRGYLDSVIGSRQFKERKIDKETVYALGQIKKQLVKSSTENWQPYREALGKWRTLSRPLDVVERKGALKKVLDTDPISTDYAMTQAQVTGQIIAKARAGNPVFTTLLKESPELRDSARLYFTQDLFGKEAVPSAASLRTWLARNEAPLRQLGLYQEFRGIRTARETAQRAVEEAKGARKPLSDRIRLAEQAERTAKENRVYQESLREKQKKRIAETVGGIETPEQIAERASAKAKEAGTRLGQEKTAAEREIAGPQKLADKYKQARTEIESASAREVPQKARATIANMRRDGLIDDTQYTELLTQIQRVENVYGESDKSKQMIIKILGYAGLGGLGLMGAKELLP